MQLPHPPPSCMQNGDVTKDYFKFNFFLKIISQTLDLIDDMLQQELRN
jgi:hypothetical protein